MFTNKVFIILFEKFNKAHKTIENTIKFALWSCTGIWAFYLDVYSSCRAIVSLFGYFAFSWSNKKYRRIRPGRGLHYSTHIPLATCQATSKCFLCPKNLHFFLTCLTPSHIQDLNSSSTYSGKPSLTILKLISIFKHL